MKNAQKIAIVGIGCRYPDFVNNPEKLWTFLSQNGDGVREVPESRWDLDKYYDPNPEAPGKMYVKRASFLHDDPFTFDPAFFGMSPREAQTLDPQQRLLLETSYEAFQDAGIPMKQWQRRKVGVFVGGFMMDNQFLRVSEKGLPHINSHTPVSGSLTLLSNRISHAFDFCGPSISIDTACSSSLVAIHLACESLLSGNAELALAGGVNVMLGPQASILMCKGKFLARDGRSKAFFDHADGYGRGEGAGMVLLKRLDQAIADQDDIYAVIEATAVNQDGHTEGISLPSQDSQKAVIREAVAKAGIQAKEIDYVEAHGTGTKAGDPLELGAIGTLYGKPKEQPLYVGSIKTNLGHTEAAAGVSGLIKVALMLKNGRILPHLNLGKLNENIPFEELNVRIPLAGQESAYQGIRPRKAAVNSFGYGGTNAHAILSRYEAVAQPKSVNREDTGPCLIQLSARTPQALQQQARDMEAWLQAHPDTPLSSLAQHLNHKRDRHEYLQLFHPHTTKEFHKQLKSFEVDMGPSPATRSPKVAWIFTGMGPQWWGMGQQLYRKEPVFREQVEQCDTLFREAAGFSVLEELLKSESESRITRNYLAQAANFFVQMGLSALWQSWGLRPDAIVGHSVGEVAAAVVAGALSLEQGIRLIYHRGCILEEIAGKGTLLAAGISLEEAEELLPSFPGIEIATINSPQSVALAGTHEALKALEIHLLAEDRFAKFVRVEVAYHSSQADPLEEAFLQAFSFIQPQQAHTPLYSTLTGGLVRESIQDAHYWWRNVRQKVHLLSAIEAMVRDGYVNFMEIGPHPVLGSAVKEILNHLEQPGNTFFSLRRLKDEQGTLCQQLSQVIRAGVEIELPAFPNSPAIKLPLYSWDKEVYWEEAEELQRLRKGESEKHPFLQERIAGPEPLWKSSINRPALAFLKDHQVGGQIVFPGAGYVECLLALARHQQQGYPLVIEELTFDQPFTWDDNQFPELFIQEQQGEVRLTSQWEGHSKPHMKGRILAKAPFRTPVFPDSKAFPQLDSPGNSYAQLARCGLAYGPAFQGIEAISLQEREVFAHLQAPQGSEHFVLHPALLDAAFQALLLAGQQYVEQKAFLPIRIRSLRIFQEAPRSAYCYGRITLMKGEFLEADLQLLNEAREVVVEVKGLRCKQVSLQQAENPRKEWLYQYRWEAADLRQNASSSQLPLFTGRELANELPQDPFQLLIDLRPFASKDLFSQALSANQHLREWLRRPGLQKAKRVSILLENALLDESQYPTPPTNPAQSALLGQIRVAMTEMPEINLRVIDADHTPATDLLLAALLELEWDQEEIILREGKSYAGSLQRSQLSFPERESHRKVMPTAQPRRLDILKPGKLESLVLRDYSLGAPQGDELRIKVSHSSINFKDVMKAMGMLNDAALKDTFAGHEFGLEGTGVVEACGPDVSRFQAGDRVYFMAAGLKTHLNVSEQVCVRIPEGLELEEMASIFVYLTAWAGLVKTARLQAGEKVLIHSAAGGVGLSACHIARMIGAEVHATAGTEEKRQFLREMGIPFVYDSRSLNFADEVMAHTGSGVDVVLNSLAGEPLRKSLSLLRTMGRFVELGKQDITQGQALNLAPFNRSIQFSALDLDKITPLNPAFMREMVEELFQHFLAGSLPILPYQVLKVNQLEDAFRKLAQGSLIGKILVDFEVEELLSVPELEKDFDFAPDEVALITGGCSGFGLQSALYLADWGLKHLILSGRRGQVPESEHWVVEKLERKGVTVLQASLDVTDFQQMKVLRAKLEVQGLRLCGVLHAATLLHDKLIEQLSEADFERGFRAKALGGWNLHRLTQDLPLKFFLCYSSIVSYTGNPGQASYAAANAFLDGLVAWRKAQGLTGSSISWGAIDEVGILTRNAQANGHLKSVGVTPIRPDLGLSLLKEATLHQLPHLAIAKVDWNRWTQATPGSWQRLQDLVQREGTATDWPEAVQKLLALDESERLPATLQEVSEILSRITGTQPEKLTEGTALASLGMDSIMAVELTVEFQSVLGVELSVMEILGAGSLLLLAQSCLKKISQLTEALDQGQVRHAQPEKARELTEHYLEKICVGRPYFDLKSIQQEQEGLSAWVEPLLQAGDLGMWTSEGARHMAILGSCVAADANPEAGRFCYPVKLARVKALTDLSQEIPEERYRIFACLQDFDKVGARAEVSTWMVNRQGEKLLEMQVSFHVIPAEGLKNMFSKALNPTPDWQSAERNPYRKAVLDPLVFESDEVAVLPQLKPENCVGHFQDLPAFPVSIMTRYAGQLLSRRLGTSALRFEHGICETSRFIFAGARVSFRLSFAGQEKGLNKWECHMYADGEHAATFTYFLADTAHLEATSSQVMAISH